jgi:hypothetical protein
MSSDRPQESPTVADGHDKSDAPRPATVLVRGETIRDQQTTPPTDAAPGDKNKPPQQPVSEAKLKMQSRLPALDDDGGLGVEKPQLVTRDGKADLAFTGTLLASAAPTAAPDGRWQEYRVYETNGGKHVFSKVTRSVFADQADACDAEIFDPTPTSVPSKLLRSAHDLTHSTPMTWTDAAVAFFGYDPLAKDLYRKLSTQFEEHIA